MLDFNLISAFSKVGEFGSFTKAAKHLGIPKSRLSRQVSELEEKLSLKLIYRTTRVFKLTEEGKIFYQKAHEHLVAIENICEEMDPLHREISGKIRLTAPEDLAIWFLPKIVNEFTAIYPRIQFEFIFTSLILDLNQEQVDVAIRVGHLPSSTLKNKRIGELKNILVAAPEFLLKHGDLSDLADLASIPAVGFASSVKNMICEWKVIAGEEEVTIKLPCRVVTNTMDSLLSFVLAGQGIGFVPEFMAREAILEGKLVHLFKSVHSKAIPLQFVMPGGKALSKKVRAFLDFSFDKLQNQL